MAATDNLNCPSCGAPLEIKNRFTKIVVCEYCGSHVDISGANAVPKGKFPKLADFPTIFGIGKSGKIRGKSFRVLGRMRYNYGSGFWDEWYVEYGDDGLLWLQEDEGTLTMFYDHDLVSEFPSYDEVRPGKQFHIGDRKILVKEKGKAKIEGGEGELHHYYEPGTEVYYIDGISEGKKVSLEFGETEVEYFIGEPLRKSEIEFDE